MLTPRNTYIALLIVQALHLLHHRITKRHISFAEVISAFVLCVPWWIPLPALHVYGNTRRVNYGASSRKCLDQKTLA